MNPLDKKQQKKREAELGSMLDKEVAEVLTIINELEGKGTDIVEAAVSKELKDANKKAALAEIRGAVGEADVKVKNWLAPAVGAAYVSGVNYADEMVKSFGIPLKGDKLTVEILRGVEDFAPHLEVVNSLIGDAYGDFGGGMSGYVKGSERILNDATRKQLQAKIATGRLEGASVKQIKKELVGVLEGQGLRSLLDKGGRQWTLERYSEMLVRTHLIKANNEATLLRGQEYDIDIVQVSTHGAQDALCKPKEGRIFSISGKSENYPQAAVGDLPTYHPNCKHSVLLRPDLS